MRYLKSLLISSIISTAYAADVLQSSGFTNCANNADIKVNRANITFDRASGQVVFDVSGTSVKSQNVNATLVVTAYGNTVYSKSFDPCAEKIVQLCPGKIAR
jgi:hypothetical protein